MTDVQRQFITNCIAEARSSGHIFPEMAACEAALESTYGTSLLAIKGLNLFGVKQHSHPIYGSISLMTREYVNLQVESVMVEWVSYPTLRDCFEDRMRTLQRLSAVFPHYNAALHATTAEEYVTEVSKTWSTDPARAQKVLSIFASLNTSASGAGA